jgi:uncharacterized membrane protein
LPIGPRLWLNLVGAGQGGTTMQKSRLEAFSDGVIAIIITIMVLELKVPHDTTAAALLELWPIFLSYALSFLNVAIYWHNHHHLLHAARQVDGRILWANTNLLFWLSLMPFTTGWMGENHFAQWPIIIYGVDLLACGLSYFILTKQILRKEGANSTLAKALGRDHKGIIALVCYIAAIALAFVHPLIAGAIYLVVALMWFIPDSRIARAIGQS